VKETMASATRVSRLEKLLSAATHRNSDQLARCLCGSDSSHVQAQQVYAELLALLQSVDSMSIHTLPPVIVNQLAPLIEGADDVIASTLKFSSSAGCRTTSAQKEVLARAAGIYRQIEMTLVCPNFS
jgi:hypothetical protein